MASIKLSGNTSGEITISSPDVAGTHTLTLPSTSETLATQNSLGVRNLIINGDMRIDQRNAGASATINSTSTYFIDRFSGRIMTGSGHTIQQVTDAPSGFTHSAKITIGTGGSPASTDRGFTSQDIEGLNMSHLDWGTSDAKTITISFWVKSSLTGTFGGAIQDSSNAYSYPFTYTISAANTWEQKSITVEGPTSGSFSTDNTRGMVLRIDFGTGSTYSSTAGSWQSGDYRAATGVTSLVATSGATFYITGVQLEVGTEATPFEHRPYDMELQRCMRYYETSYNTGVAIGSANDNGSCMWLSNRNTGLAHHGMQFRVTKRANPSINIYSPTTGAVGKVSNLDAGPADQTAVESRIGMNGFTLYDATSLGLGQFLQYHYVAIAEL